MKIIKRGTPPSEDIFGGTCFRCKTVIECTRAEVPKVEYDQRDDDEYGNVKCPVCAGLISVGKIR